MSPKNQKPSIEHRLAVSTLKEAAQKHVCGTEPVTVRKRRRPSETTVNACNSCRKKRTKCDGNNPCAKCSSHPGSQCTYEVNTRISKEDMKREIMDLRRSHSLAMRILDSLAADREVPSILKGLRAQEDLASIARLLESSPASEPQAILVDSPLTEEPADSPYGSLAGTSLEGSQPSYSGGSQQRPDSVANPSTRTNQSRLGPWRTTLVNEFLIKHLISLYWVWIHPAHPILNMARFFKDYETRGSRHCSAYLINAICAAACDLLNPEWENVPGKKTDVVALKQHLIAEAAIQAALADPEASTTADASAVISILNNRNVRTATPGF